MLSLQNTIQLKEDISAGPGKLSIYTDSQGKQNGDSYVAVAHSDAVELVLLDEKGNVLQQDVLPLDDMIVDRPNEIQIIWCVDEPVLIVGHTNQLLRIGFDSSTKSWKADLNRSLEQHGWITALAVVEDCIYTGSSEGLWEVGCKDMQTRTQLGHFSTTVICVSNEYLAAGDEQGGLNLYHGGPNSWLQSQRVQESKRSCCTSLLLHQEDEFHVLVAAYSTGTIRAYSLPKMDCLAETAAHIRWITQIVPVKGGFLSAAEDGFLHMWTLESTDEKHCTIRYLDSLKTEDCLITGAAALSDSDVLISAYDRPQLFWVIVSEENGDEEKHESNDEETTR